MKELLLSLSLNYEKFYNLNNITFQQYRSIGQLLIRIAQELYVQLVTSYSANQVIIHRVFCLLSSITNTLIADTNIPIDIQLIFIKLKENIITHFKMLQWTEEVLL